MGKKFTITHEGKDYTVDGVDSAEAAAEAFSEMLDAKDVDSDALGLSKQFAEGFTFGGFGELTALTSVAKDWAQRDIPFTKYPWGKMIAGAERQIQARMDKYAGQNIKKSIAGKVCRETGSRAKTNGWRPAEKPEIQAPRRSAG